MKVLLIPNNSQGVINLKQTKHFIFDNITDINQILAELIAKQENQFNYKYCLFEANGFIPFIFRIKDKIFNQIQEFECERITYAELDVDEKVKEKMIKGIIKQDRTEQERVLLNKGLSILIHAYGGDGDDKGLKDIALQLDALDKDVDYKEFLNKIV